MCVRLSAADAGGLPADDRGFMQRGYRISASEGSPDRAALLPCSTLRAKPAVCLPVHK